jgi:hypothetical protein
VKFVNRAAVLLALGTLLTGVPGCMENIALIGRPTIEEGQGGKGKAKRDRLISQAVNQHGYSQMEVARHLKLHYSTVSRLIKSVNEEQR